MRKLASVLLLALICLYFPGRLAAQIYDFNNTSDLTTYFNPGSSPAFSNISLGGLGSTGCIDVTNADLWTSKTGYQNGKIVLSAYFYNGTGSGYGGLGIAPSSANDLKSAACTSIGLGVVFHGGGGMFVNNGAYTDLVWPPDLSWNTWYYMLLTIEYTGNNTYNLNFQIWNSDVIGILGTMKTEHTLNGVINRDLGQATQVYPYFAASDSRFTKMDELAVTSGSINMSSTPYSGSSTITATVIKDNAPAQGETVTFSATSGTLSATSATTDANGQASVTITGLTSWAKVTGTAASITSNETYVNVNQSTLTQAKNLSFTDISNIHVVAAWNNGNGDTRCVFVNSDVNAANPAPVNGHQYQTGEQIGTSGWFCKYNGNGSSATLIGLTKNTTYKVMVCEYAGTGSQIVYKNNSEADNPVTVSTTNLDEIDFCNASAPFTISAPTYFFDCGGPSANYGQYDYSDVVMIPGGAYDLKLSFEEFDVDENSIFYVLSSDGMSYFNAYNNANPPSASVVSDNGFELVYMSGGVETRKGWVAVVEPNLPYITSFTPDIAITGTSVTIRGRNLTGATAVSFGGTAASSFTVVDAKTITAVVAAGASGDVSVTTPLGTAAKSGFTFTNAPIVQSVDVPADGTYLPGQSLDFKVNFSQAVTVTGNPVLPITLNTGGVVNASYYSGSGTASPTFRYTVATGQADPDGISVGSALSLDGGTIRDGSSRDAVLTLYHVGATYAILIDGIPPALTTQAVTDVEVNSAIGNGEIINPGSSAVTQHGIVWGTGHNPTTALTTKTEQGSVFATGTFTSSIIGLQPNTLYYVRAYATNNAGTGYGDEVSFTSDKITQSITFNALDEKTYGDADFTPVASASSTLAVAFSSSDESVATVVSGNIHVVGAGTCTIYADQSGDNTFAAADQVSQTLTVNKAELTVTADDQTKVYGKENPELTFSYSGWVNGDEALDEAPAITTTVDATTGAGIYTGAITLSGGSDNNYELNLGAGDFEITKATLNVTADNQTKVYGENNPELTFGYSGWVNGDEALDEAPAITTTIDATTGAGNHAGAITLSGGSDNNYELDLVAGDFDITKATLNVTADNQAKVYGDENPDFTVTYDGFVNDDNENSFTATPVATSTAGQYSDVNTYSIIPSGGESDNYSFSYHDGTLTIEKATLEVTAENKTRDQGQNNPEFTLSYSGFKGSDNASVIDELPVASCTADGTSAAGDYGIVLSGGTDNNYNLTLHNGTLTVNAVTGLDDHGVSSISLYPNPAGEFVNISNLPENTEIRIFDIQGQLVKTLTSGDSTEHVDLRGLSAGLYMIRLSGNGMDTAIRFVKK
jgi:hypothetical protein